MRKIIYIKTSLGSGVNGGKNIGKLLNKIARSVQTDAPKSTSISLERKGMRKELGSWL